MSGGLVILMSLAVSETMTETEPGVAFAVGVAFEAQGELEEARGAYQTCLRSQDPEWSARAALALGLLLRESDRPAATEFLRSAVDSGHQEWASTAAVHLGGVLLEDGDSEGAIAAFWIAAEHGDREVAPHAAMQLGVLLASFGKASLARAAYEKAIATGHPNEAPRAAVNLGLLLVDSDPGRARQVLELAMSSRHTEQSPMAALNLSALLLKQNDHAAAIRALEFGIASNHPTWAPVCTEVLENLRRSQRKRWWQLW
jgi:tetratricopeptide (TPR) repeat protein